MRKLEVYFEGLTADEEDKLTKLIEHHICGDAEKKHDCRLLAMVVIDSETAG